MRKQRLGIPATVLMLVLTLSACSSNSGDILPGASADTAMAETEASTTLTPEVSGDDAGASWNPETVTITQAGEYSISGKLTQIIVAATSDDTVKLILNGAEINNPAGAGIYASQCDKLIITLADGTTNTVTDGGANFKYTLEADEEPNAAIFSKDDLTINGSGSLTVNAAFNNGIGTKDDLTIAGGTINVTTVNNAIKGNDSVTVTAGKISIQAGNDGIQTSNGTDPGKGFVTVDGGSLSITAGHDGIQAETTLSITGGTFNIVSNGGDATDSDSYKGLKAGSDLSVSGGTFTISSTDDAIHTNGSAVINGGEFTISSGDDGIHADGDLTIKNGAIHVIKSYEGIEGGNIDISGGNITVVASDDGLNAAGGVDGSGTATGRFGGDNFAGGSSHAITITGGKVTLYAGSDVIDSNGTVNVTGGTVCVFKMQGEGELFDANSTTVTPALSGTTALSAGSTLSVLSGDSSLWSGTVENPSTSFALIIPGLVNGTSYTLQYGNTETVVAASTTVQNGMGGGQGGGQGGGNGGRRGGRQTL